MLKNKKSIFENIEISDVPYDFFKMYKEMPEEIMLQLEEKRRNIILSKIVVTFIVIFGVLLSFFYVSLEETISFDKIGIFYIFLLCIIATSSIYFKEQYTQFYKEKIIGRLVKYVNSEYKYILNDKLERKDVYNIAKKCVNINNKIIRENDRIEGEISSGIFYIMNINEKYQRTSNIKKRILTFANLLKGINTRIEVISSKRSIFKYEQDELKNLNYRTFDEKFDVYSENEDIISRILTTDIMDLIVDFYDRTNIEFKIIYENDKLYFYFETEELFEPKLHGDIVDLKCIYIYKLLIDFVIEVVENSNKIIKTIII